MPAQAALNWLATINWFKYANENLIINSKQYV